MKTEILVSINESIISTNEIVCSKNWAQQTESSLNRVSRHHEMYELRSALKSSVLACELSVIIHRIPRSAHIKSIGRNPNSNFDKHNRINPKDPRRAPRTPFNRIHAYSPINSAPPSLNPLLFTSCIRMNDSKKRALDAGFQGSKPWDPCISYPLQKCPRRR